MRVLGRGTVDQVIQDQLEHCALLSQYRILWFVCFVYFQRARGIGAQLIGAICGSCLRIQPSREDRVGFVNLSYLPNHNVYRPNYPRSLFLGLINTIHVKMQDTSYS
jgi:hypothetical protein